LTLQASECTQPSWSQKILTLRIPNRVALPALEPYCNDLDSLMQQQLGNGLLLPVWTRLLLNDGQECGPLRLDIAVQKQLKARSGYKFLVHGLNKVFSNESHLAVIKATCWHLELPSLFCRIRCPTAVAVEISGAVQGL